MKTIGWHRNAALITPLLLVNAAAIYGQSGWAFDHLGHRWTVAVLFALAVESIGVFLAAEAHAALMAGHASGALRIGSYAVGALVGTLNYAHYATQPGYRPNPLAVTFGLLSSISPWLWAIRSRSINRERLADMGLIDPRAVKFSRLRWTLFPLRTFTAFRAAVWAGIQRPDEAVAAADARRPMGNDERAAAVAEAADLAAQLTIERDNTRVLAEALTQARRHTPALAAPAEPAPAGPPPTEAPAPAGDDTPTAADPAPVAKTRPRPQSTRRPPSAAKVVKAAARMPGATVAQIAAKAGVSEATVRRHLRAAAQADRAAAHPDRDATVASPTPLRPAETPAPAAA
jgi:hypothetical protein